MPTTTKLTRIHLHTPPNPTCSRWYDHEWLKADYKPDSPTHPTTTMLLVYCNHSKMDEALPLKIIFKSQFSHLIIIYITISSCSWDSRGLSRNISVPASGYLKMKDFGSLMPTRISSPWYSLVVDTDMLFTKTACPCTKEIKWTWKTKTWLLIL